MTTVLDVFPRRALKMVSYGTSIRPSLWSIVGIGMFVVMLYFDVIHYVPDLIDELRLGHGTPAAESGIADGGKCETNRGLTTCSFKAQYRTPDGRNYEKQLHYATFMQTVPDKTPLQVSYDDKHPTHVSTNWGRHLLMNRVILQLLAFGLEALLVWYVVRETLWRSRVRKSVELAAGHPLPIVASFAAASPTRSHTDVSFKWTYPATGVESTDRSRFPRGGQPFWLDANKTQMLALAGPDGHAHLLDANLSSVGLSVEEKLSLFRFRGPTVKV